MGIDDYDVPRLSEIGRTLNSLDRKIDDFRNEIRAQLNDKVSKETYEAQRQAAADRILALEQTIRSANARFWGGFGSVVVALVLAYLELK
jgi:hypothetical protein